MLDTPKAAVPFDTRELDKQMEAAGLDVLIANSKHNIHYQLGQAYQKLGRSDLAQREFDLYRELKDKLAGRTP